MVEKIFPAGSRKLYVMIYFAHFWALLLGVGWISEAVFQFLESTTVGGYFASNVGEHFAKRG